jgi:hypothetical protein
LFLLDHPCSTLPAIKNDTTFATIAGTLAGSTVRVGGITADWVRYVPSSACLESPADCVTLPLEAPPRAGSYWPTAPNNLSYSDFDALVAFCGHAGLRLLFDLNELYGRNCQTTNPATGQGDWCVGAWDTSNLKPFLQHIHDTARCGGVKRSGLGWGWGWAGVGLGWGDPALRCRKRAQVGGECRMILPRILFGGCVAHVAPCASPPQ